MKNQNLNIFKPIMALLTIMVLMAGLSLAQDLEFTPKIEELPQESFMSKLWQPFVVTGGDTNTDGEVLKGTVLSDVKLTVKVKEDISGFCKKATGTSYQYTNKFELYWYLKDSGDKKSIGTFYIKNKYNVGDYFNIKFSDLDTSKISDSWLNKGVRVGATHYVCQADILGHGSQGMFFGKWVIDNTNPGADRSTNDDFTLIDDSNKCERKYLRTICEDNSVKKEYQTVRTDSNGECERDYTTIDHCSMTEKCQNGKCVTDSNAEPKCSLKNLYVVNLDNTLTLCMKNGVGYCDEGVCKIPEDNTNQGSEGNNEVTGSGSEPQNECECQEGETLVAKCEDGSDTVLFECDGCYMKELVPDCTVNEQEEPKYVDEEGNVINVVGGNGNSFWKNNQLTIGISSAVILLGGAYIFLFNPFKKNRRRSNKKRK